MTVLAWLILSWQAFATATVFVQEASKDKVAMALAHVINLGAVVWTIHHLMVLR